MEALRFRASRRRYLSCPSCSTYHSRSLKIIVIIKPHVAEQSCCLNSRGRNEDQWLMSRNKSYQALSGERHAVDRIGEGVSSNVLILVLEYAF